MTATGTNEMAMKNIFYTEQTRAAKNLLHRHDEPNEPTKEGPLSFVLFESPFTSVSGDHPSLLSLSPYL